MTALLRRFLVFVFYSFLLTPLFAEAGVFQCVKANGEVEFRDRPCAISSEEQSFLPHRYLKTEMVDNKTTQKQEKKLQQQIQAQTKLENKEERQKLKAEKKREKELAATERRKLRCERLDEKIARLESQLQQGKKIKTYKRLEAELAQAQLMKKRYCSMAL